MLAISKFPQGNSLVTYGLAFYGFIPACTRCLICYIAPFLSSSSSPDASSRPSCLSDPKALITRRMSSCVTLGAGGSGAAGSVDLFPRECISTFMSVGASLPFFFLGIDTLAAVFILADMLKRFKLTEIQSIPLPKVPAFMVCRSDWERRQGWSEQAVRGMRPRIRGCAAAVVACNPCRGGPSASQEPTEGARTRR